MTVACKGAGLGHVLVHVTGWLNMPPCLKVKAMVSNGFHQKWSWCFCLYLSDCCRPCLSLSWFHNQEAGKYIDPQSIVMLDEKVIFFFKILKWYSTIKPDVIFVTSKESRNSSAYILDIYIEGSWARVMANRNYLYSSLDSCVTVSSPQIGSCKKSMRTGSFCWGAYVCPTKLKPAILSCWPLLQWAFCHWGCRCGFHWKSSFAEEVGFELGCERWLEFR